MIPSQLATWQDELADAGPEQVLRFAYEQFGEDVTLASALGLEAQVLTHLIAKLGLPIPIFTLDTGRLFDETYALIAETERRYQLRLNMFLPDAAEVERLVNEGGTNLFRRGLAQRKACCAVRKVGPLRRALAGKQAWMTGLRADQSVTRTELKVIDWDANHGLIKINPLLNWTENQVWQFVTEHGVPYNILFNRGYASIGCAPCTRAIKPGEDIRAGRWWWEDAEHKECGLHVDNGQSSRLRQPVSV